ncbi:hypothetical protein HNY73_022546 [Argiope bruennichi]|uniref:Chitin-binding type-4 domain-containing protein n=1 Tax=Argiope bruennichi TaxID=94029 RepID=A0A8T0E4V3_ARGBR|nr:hypothetical protein HNY73_022546 [Argiope bruennichi]
MQMVLWTIISIWLQLPILVWSHARLMIPPSRSSMWRLGFPTKRNFNDNALYCGGIQIQWQRNGGKCGICGDPYNMPHPRENEAGGKYGEGIISGHYSPGQIMDAVVDVTTNHRGYFEFKICPNNNPKKEATQECLDKYPLKLANGGGTKYYIGNKGNGGITVKLQLPKGLSCSQCVFQWTYVAEFCRERGWWQEPASYVVSCVEPSLVQWRLRPSARSSWIGWRVGSMAEVHPGKQVSLKHRLPVGGVCGNVPKGGIRDLEQQFNRSFRDRALLGISDGLTVVGHRVVGKESELIGSWTRGLVVLLYKRLARIYCRVITVEG